MARLGLGIAVAAVVACAAEPDTSAVTAAGGAPDTARPAGPAQPEPAETSGPGSTHQVVDPTPGAIARPVGIDEVAEFGNGVRARLGSIEPVEAEGHLPGERSGPAVAVSVEVVNGSSRTITLDTVTVDLTTRDGSSAYGVVVPARRPLAGDLAAGDTASGDYVFSLAPGDRTDVRVHVKYSAGTPTIVFQGTVGDG